MRADSGMAGGRGPRQAQGTQRQHLAGGPWLLSLAEALPASGAGQGPVLRLGCAATATVQSCTQELGAGGCCEGTQCIMRKYEMLVKKQTKKKLKDISCAIGFPAFALTLGPGTSGTLQTG